jgi:hypothetical protein
LLAAFGAYYCGPVNRELGVYKLSPQVSELLASPAYAGTDTLGVMYGINPYALQFYRPELEVEWVNVEQAVGLLQRHQPVLCVKPACDELRQRVPTIERSDAISYFPVQAMTPRFLNRATRPGVMRQAWVLR